MNHLSNPTATELRATAMRLIEFADQIDQSVGNPEMGSRNRPVDELRLLSIATDLYKSRRERTKWLSSGLLGEPSWDILLDLFIMTMRHKSVPITSSCIASAAPPTTALRYVQSLEEEGLIFREKGVSDKRVCYLKLTDRGRRAMINAISSFDFSASISIRPTYSSEEYLVIDKN